MAWGLKSISKKSRLSHLFLLVYYRCVLCQCPIIALWDQTIVDSCEGLYDFSLQISWLSDSHSILAFLCPCFLGLSCISHSINPEHKHWILVSDKVLKDQNILHILCPGSQNLSINFRQRSGAESYLFQHVLLQHLLPATAAAAATPPVTWDTRATCRRSKIDWLAYKCLDCVSWCPYSKVHLNSERPPIKYH